MGLGKVKASVFAIRKQSETGTLVVPSAASQFIPLRAGFTMAYSNEKLESDELLNDIGATKPANGLETIEGTHPIYLKHSGTEGQEPESGILYESILGSKTVNATEYQTTGSPTTTVIPVADGTNFYVGQALLIKDGTNGYSIRNVESISTNDLTLNFALEDAPATGVSMGKAVSYIPTSTSVTPFSAWKYNANGYSIEAVQDCIVTGLSATFESNQFATAEFTYSGVKYFLNPIVITSSNKYIDWTDDDGTAAASVEEKVYRSPVELAETLENAMNAQTSETISVSYSSTDGKFTISSSTSATLSLLWDSGTNTANTIGEELGFTVSADDTSATSYESDNAIDLSAEYTPSYDDTDKIVIKNAELIIGSQEDNVCRCASTVTIEITQETEDALCICEETGIQEKVPVSRAVTLSATINVEQYDVLFFNNLINNSTVGAMLNIGPKSSGNFVAGKCMNMYIANATVDSYQVGGENILTAEISLSGFVTSDKKDIYINFL